MIGKDINYKNYNGFLIVEDLFFIHDFNVKTLNYLNKYKIIKLFMDTYKKIFFKRFNIKGYQIDLHHFDRLQIILDCDKKIDSIILYVNSSDSEKLYIKFAYEPLNLLEIKILESKSIYEVARIILTISDFDIPNVVKEERIIMNKDNKVLYDIANLMFIFNSIR